MPAKDELPAHVSRIARPAGGSAAAKFDRLVRPQGLAKTVEEDERITREAIRQIRTLVDCSDRVLDEVACVGEFVVKREQSIGCRDPLHNGHGAALFHSAQAELKPVLEAPRYTL